MIFRPICWTHSHEPFAVMLDKRKWVDRTSQHTRVTTRSDGGWDAIAEQPEKCRWRGGGGNKRRLGI